MVEVYVSCQPRSASFKQHCANGLWAMRALTIIMLFVNYPKCSTCRKAKNWLDENAIEYESRHIVDDNPQADEIKEWWEKSDLPLKRFFNTSGMKYRELKLKDKLPGMSEEEQFDLLATDGMLVKRPILVGDDFVLVGFKVKEWEEKLL